MWLCAELLPGRLLDWRSRGGSRGQAGDTLVADTPLSGFGWPQAELPPAKPRTPPPPACIPSALPRSPFLPAGKPPVLSVNPHVPALLAYAQLAAQQVSGAPVVTDGGELIANLSISDIRWAGGSCMRGRPTRGACLLGGRLGAQGFFSQTLVYRRPPPNLPACHAGPSLRSSLARWRCRWPSS